MWVLGICSGPSGQEILSFWVPGDQSQENNLSPRYNGTMNSLPFREGGRLRPSNAWSPRPGPSCTGLRDVLVRTSLDKVNYPRRGPKDTQGKSHPQLVCSEAHPGQSASVIPQSFQAVFNMGEQPRITSIKDKFDYKRK